MERGGPRRRRGILSWVPWRLLALLAVFVIVVRLFFCTVLRVQSESMEPALHGDPSRGDELLVLKPFYRLFEPERFDLVVFERKGDDVRAEERVSVKRVAAIGGETIRIDHGDLFVASRNGDERRVVKPYREFRPLLVPLWREPFDGQTESRLYCRNDAATYERGAVTVAGAEQPTALELGDAVDFDDGWIDARGIPHDGQTPVKDVLFELEIEADSIALVLGFNFISGGDELEFTLVPKGAGHAVHLVRRSLSDSMEYPESASFRQITPGSPHRLEFWQIDGQVGLAVDGRKELDVPLPGGPGVMSRGADVRNVTLTVQHGTLRLTRFDVWRDLHFTDDGTYGVVGAFDVPDGEVFVLGDSSFQSTDSRHFGSIARSDLLGAPILIVGPSSRVRALRGPDLLR